MTTDRPMQAPPTGPQHSTRIWTLIRTIIHDDAYAGTECSGRTSIVEYVIQRTRKRVVSNRKKKCYNSNSTSPATLLHTVELYRAPGKLEWKRGLHPPRHQLDQWRWTTTWTTASVVVVVYVHAYPAPRCCDIDLSSPPASAACVGEDLVHHRGHLVRRRDLAPVLHLHHHEPQINHCAHTVFGSSISIRPPAPASSGWRFRGQARNRQPRKAEACKR